jgi:uncharacterized repeat protein (TIGR03803 family)
MRRCFRALCKFASGVALAVPLHAARAETLLYAFKAGNDGAVAYSGLIKDSAGNLYGTTWWGGGSNCGDIGCGTVYRITPTGNETLLYSFKGGNDGAWPYGGLIKDSAGNLYGTTYQGGTDNAGTVFKLTPNGIETVLHSFGPGNDGGFPYGDLIIDSKGNLYGTTSGGGIGGNGTVFKVAHNGTEKVLYAFAGYPKDGANPWAGLTRDGSGNLYSTTEYGGAHNSGTIFKLAPNGKESLLYTFTGGNNTDGAWPFGGLIKDSAGNLYGTTTGGGVYSGGTVFKVAPNGAETVIYAFAGYPNDGSFPGAGLIADSAGNVYGTTAYGGMGNAGTVFKLAPNGTETVLYAFTGGSDGANPAAHLTIDKGRLYGTTYQGGGTGCFENGCGTVFNLAE